MLSRFSLAVFALLFVDQSFSRSAGELEHLSLHGHALVDAKLLVLELTQDLGVDGIYGDLREAAPYEA